MYTYIHSESRGVHIHANVHTHLIEREIQICIKYASYMDRHLIKRHTHTCETYTYMYACIHSRSREIHMHAYIHTHQIEKDPHTCIHTYPADQK